MTADRPNPRPASFATPKSPTEFTPDDASTQLPGEQTPHHPVLHNASKPPRWLARGLVMAVITVFIGIFAWNALGDLKSLGVNLLISLFIALALEPFVVWLVRHGWRRGAAAGAVLVSSLLAIVVLIALFGNLFISQLASLVESIPGLYDDLAQWIQDTFNTTIPASSDVLNNFVQQYGTDVASGALTVGTILLSGIFAVFTILLVTYYLLAAGPKFRAAICGWLTPNRQQDVLTLWEVSQGKVSDFINSRVVLAALNSIFTYTFLMIVRVPNALPLAIFCGIVSQFVPTIGTYIGGALPCIVALTSRGLPTAIGVLIFIVAYQQLENLYFAPKVSAKALEMNPAVSFIVVIAFGAVFGALGAFLSLPVAATIQAVANTYFQRHDLIESHMLHDPNSSRTRGRPGQEGNGWVPVAGEESAQETSRGDEPSPSADSGEPPTSS